MALVLSDPSLAPEALPVDDRPLERRRRNKRRLLCRMIAYAEGDRCRRREILRYFGEETATQPRPCCDVCERSSVPIPERAPRSDSDRLVLDILGCVRSLNPPIGVTKTAQILSGSRSMALRDAGYDASPFYARHAGLSQKRLISAIDRIVAAGLLRTVGGQYPVLRLATQGEQVHRARGGAGIELDDLLVPSGSSRADTVEETHRLLRTGASTDDIAKHRDLAPSTINSHLAQLIRAGRVSLDAVMDQEIQKLIRPVVEEFREERLASVKARLPSWVSYDQIRLVQADLHRSPNADEDVDPPAESELQQNAVPDLLEHLTDDAPGIRMAAVRTLGILTVRILHALKALTEDPNADVTRSVQNTMSELKRYLSSDAVDRFLSRAHPMELKGTFDLGYALDFNSRFEGRRWRRTEIGEMVYRLKYRFERNRLDALADRIQAFLTTIPDLTEIDLIVPVPCTLKDRPFDPMVELARALGRKTNVDAETGLLRKARSTQPQKNMEGQVQKNANVHRAFETVSPERIAGKHVLLIDDLYDSGATLDECARVLARACAARVYALALTRTIHH